MLVLDEFSSEDIEAHAEVIYQLGEEHGLCVEVRFPAPRPRDDTAA